MSTTHDEWVERCMAHHAEEVGRGLHDARCEYNRARFLCHCSKRRREAAGFTTPPDDDLYFPPPSCSRCDGDLDHDGDSWQCYECCLSWDSSGRGDSCTFTDDFGSACDDPTNEEQRHA